MKYIHIARISMFSIMTTMLVHATEKKDLSSTLHIEDTKEVIIEHVSLIEALLNQQLKIRHQKTKIGRKLYKDCYHVAFPDFQDDSKQHNKSWEWVRTCFDTWYNVDIDENGKINTQPASYLEQFRQLPKKEQYDLISYQKTHPFIWYIISLSRLHAFCHEAASFLKKACFKRGFDEDLNSPLEHLSEKTVLKAIKKIKKDVILTKQILHKHPDDDIDTHVRNFLEEQHAIVHARFQYLHKFLRKIPDHDIQLCHDNALLYLPDTFNMLKKDSFEDAYTIFKDALFNELFTEVIHNFCNK